MLTQAERAEMERCLIEERGLSPLAVLTMKPCFDRVTEPVVPPEPPDPPEPPTGGCKEGSLALAGTWWNGWCGDERGNFADGPDYGIMRSNANAVRLLRSDGARIPEGRVELDVMFATDRVPEGTGGLHIMAPISAHAFLGSPRGTYLYKGWLRADFQIIALDGPEAGLRIGLYNLDGNGAKWKNDVVVGIWNTDIILTPKQWLRFDVGWKRAGDEWRIEINGDSHTFDVSPTSYDILGWSVGNMDGLANFGGTPEVRYRNFRVIA